MRFPRLTQFWISRAKRAKISLNIIWWNVSKYWKLKLRKNREIEVIPGKNSVDYCVFTSFFFDITNQNILTQNYLFRILTLLIWRKNRWKSVSSAFLPNSSIPESFLEFVFHSAFCSSSTRPSCSDWESDQ